MGENVNPCKYCRGIDGVYYHRIDGKLYKRDNYENIPKENLQKSKQHMFI